MRSFGVFKENIQSLGIRNQRLKLNRSSLHADIIKDRSESLSISFEDIMQADFILFIAGLIQSKKRDEYFIWWPETLIYNSRGSIDFEVFLRAESTVYFNKLCKVLDIKKKEELKVVEENDYKIFGRFSPSILNAINYENLCIR